MSNQQDIQQAIQLFQTGKIEQATKILECYISHFPDDVSANLLDAAISASKNDFAAVIERCKKVLKIDPVNINASYNAAVASEKLHNYQDTLKFSLLVLKQDKQNVHAIFLYITALISLGQHQACIDFLKSFPESLIMGTPAISMKLAECYMSLTDYDKALNIFRQNINANINVAENFHNTGIIMDRQDKRNNAIQAYQSAVAAAPKVLASNYNLAFVLDKTGNKKEALKSINKCFEILDSHKVRQAFVQILSTANAENVDSVTEKHLLEVMADKETNAQALSAVVIKLLNKKCPVINELYQRANNGDYKGFVIVFSEGISQLSNNFMLQLFFANLPITNYGFECFAKMLRSALLFNCNDAIPGLDNLCAALAIRCYINGYVFTVNKNEKNRLSEIIATMQKDQSSVYNKNIAMLSMYVSLYELHKTYNINFQLTKYQEIFKDLVKLQLEDNISDNKIYHTIALTRNITDKTSLIVQQQYECNPYPVWQRLSVRQQEPVKQIIDRVTFYNTGFKIGNNSPDILIAGCGTGSHAIQTAMRIQHNAMTAIDLSRRSLSFAKRKAVEYGFEHIDFKQLDILYVSNLGKKFDIIESVGVLHHMQDPLTGLRSLADILNPGGLMNIGLYSKLGRRYIINAKSIYDDSNRSVSDDNIRQLRIDIMNADNEELVKNISGFNDFYSLHECRDLIFHENENNYNLDEISAMLASTCLEFIGFDLLDDRVINRFRKMFPEKNSLSQLKYWRTFEEQYPDTFASMYVFWCKKRS